MSRLERSPGSQDEPVKPEMAEQPAWGPVETVTKLSQELRQAEPSSPIDKLNGIKQILEMPDFTDKQWEEKLTAQARLTKALSLSLFNETPLRPDNIITAIRRHANAVTEHASENTSCSFTAMGQHMFAFALEQGPGTDRPATQTKRILTHYNEYAAQLDDKAKAEGGIGYASALAACGPDFTYQSGIIAQKTVAAAERHQAETGEEVLSPGERYVLGGILDRARRMAGRDYTGGALKEEAWAELQDQDRDAAQCFANMDAALAQASLR